MSNWLIGVYLFCLALDCFVSYRILKAHGEGMEFNPLIRWLVPKVGLFNAITLGVALPRLISLGVLGAIGSETLFAFICGGCFIFAVQQIRALHVMSILKARL